MSIKRGPNAVVKRQRTSSQRSAIRAQPFERRVWLIAFLLIAESFFTGEKMLVGVLKEIKPDERRVVMTPAGAAAFALHGHRVYVERGAGLGSGFTDQEYRTAGARIVGSAAEVWHRATMVLKVKEPLVA